MNSIPWKFMTRHTTSQLTTCLARQCWSRAMKPFQSWGDASEKILQQFPGRNEHFHWDWKMDAPLNASLVLLSMNNGSVPLSQIISIGNLISFIQKLCRDGLSYTKSIPSFSFIWSLIDSPLIWSSSVIATSAKISNPLTTTLAFMGWSPRSTTGGQESSF